MLKKGLVLLTFLFSLLGMILLMARALRNDDPAHALIATSFYYTTQSNVIVFIVLSLYVLGFRKARSFHILAYIAAVDISVTGIIFNVLLTSYVPEMNFMQYLLHLIIPILFVTFYVLIINTKLTFFNIFVIFVHPILFLMSVYLLASTYFKDLLRLTYPDFDRPEYIYPFLDPINYEQGVVGVLRFGSLVLVPLFIVLGIIFFYVKIKYPKR
jgi:hypothetical protein